MTHNEEKTPSLYYIDFKRLKDVTLEEVSPQTLYDRLKYRQDHPTQFSDFPIPEDLSVFICFSGHATESDTVPALPCQCKLEIPKEDLEEYHEFSLQVTKDLTRCELPWKCQIKNGIALSIIGKEPKVKKPTIPGKRTKRVFRGIISPKPSKY